MSDWFKIWFDTEYYHILYNHRDEQEAKEFITNLCKRIKLPPYAHVLDLACGRGRHARILAEHAWLVTGLDISTSSIQFAVEQGTPKIQYFVHDMRQPYGHQVYDAVFNLFTSFGYFDTLDDHILTLKNIEKSLKSGGYFVFDFLNARAVKEGVIPNQTIEISGIRFEISRFIENEKVVKQIVVNDSGRIYTFFERVQLFDATLLQNLITQVGLEIKALYGNIKLHSFDETTSPRVIIIAKKP
ncbi:MAG: class I SAM-dependent methyltransferase [Thermaurantimonas sp.]|uniref:class I SAM-dependent methyltransferase n=1 Tax=Thermaurantimonas sp. TaxID=2681568 RepID=UPI0039195483